MDVNGSRYHLLAGEDDWRPRLGAGAVAWDRRRRRVTLAPEIFRFPQRSSEAPLTVAERRGADRDRYGHVYWISDDRRAIHYLPRDGRRPGVFWPPAEDAADEPSKATGAFAPLPPAEAAEPPLLSGLAVTADHYLVVGRLDPGGLLIFDLHGGGPPRRLDWPAELDFTPFDLAAIPSLGGSEGGLWILDHPLAAAPRLWRLDAHLRPIAGDGVEEISAATTDAFKAVGGEARQRPAQTFPLGWQPAELALAEPRALVVLPDGAVLVLDTAGGDSVVHRFCAGRTDGPPVDLRATLDELVSPPPPLAGHDLAFVALPSETPGEVVGELFVADTAGNQTYAFRLRSGRGFLDLEALPSYLPMRRYRGRALISGPSISGQCPNPSATEDGDTDLAAAVLYDREDHWASLAELRRPRFALRGTLGPLRFDGKEAATVWHRLFLEACIPPGDQVVVESRAADEEHLLADEPWQREPQLGLRPAGGERPLDDRRTPPSPGEGTWELLFQQARGRFLELRLELRGSGRSSPALTALRAYYPRFSYLREYLPAVYREEPSFLDRFLANVEGLWTEIEGRIATVERHFDARTVPAEALPWLADWMAATFDEDWEEDRRRLLLRHLHRLYRQRGTAAGLLTAIRLATSPCPDDSLFTDQAPFGVRLVEGFRARRRGAASGASDTGSAGDLAGPRLIASGEAWQPDQGAARLHQLYRAFLDRLHPGDEPLVTRLNDLWGSSHPVDSPLLFPPQPPENGREATDWRAFLEQELAFPYAETSSADTASYRRYLARRHGTVAALNAAWGLSGAVAFDSFAAVLLPATLPSRRQTLEDWIRFVSRVLPIERGAHRFQVLVPVTADTPPAERQQRLARVRAVVERQRPAHTLAEVRLYWALFRVGSARVGIDSVVGEGSRATALALGRGALGESLLSQPHPWNLSDRRVIGRDAVA